MSRAKLRPVLAIALALGLGSAAFCAGPRELFSKIWDKRPRVSQTKLNPKNWMKEEKRTSTSSADATGRVKLDALNAIRSNLENDPFRDRQAPAIESSTPSPNGVDIPGTLTDRSRRNITRSSVQSDSSRFNASSHETRVFPDIPANARQQIKNCTSQPSQPTEEQLSPEFEALVQQIIAQRKKENTNTVQPRDSERKLTLDPSLFDANDGERLPNRNPGRETASTLNELDKQFAVEAPRPIMQINPGPVAGSRDGRSIERGELDTQENLADRSVDELISRSRNRMQSPLGQVAPRSDFATVADEQSVTQSRLQLLTQDSPHVLTQQSESDSLRMTAPRDTDASRQGQFVEKPNTDQRNSFISNRSPQTTLPRQRGFQPTETLRENSVSVPAQQMMIITPRVSSNQAPSLSVPNNEHYRQLSYEEQTSNRNIVKPDLVLGVANLDDQTHGQQNQNTEREPLLKLPQNQFESAEHSLSSQNQSSSTSNTPAERIDSESANGSLGPINWGPDPEAIAPVSAGLPWLMISAIVIGTALITSVIILMTRKAVKPTVEPMNAPVSVE